ncbi:MAG: hypothetical protein B7Y12_09685 [Rhizobiales bacterium 24-66-13]|nr:MAG: hypothetical protein B7Y61_08325 [Rhizobiales bacterium 35-66-30]OYZ78296.1 MAG: hypothetical protein B7Y12_09685 [Rhizobiales bacterium 24-66-13]OZA99740.1 MAG: hypothetical protein B7X67_21140 [Rhizobiales bacterium 39-66-18]
MSEQRNPPALLGPTAQKQAERNSERTGQHEQQGGFNLEGHHGCGLRVAGGRAYPTARPNMNAPNT